MSRVAGQRVARERGWKRGWTRGDDEFENGGGEGVRCWVARVTLKNRVRGEGKVHAYWSNNFPGNLVKFSFAKCRCQDPRPSEWLLTIRPIATRLRQFTSPFWRGRDVLFSFSLLFRFYFWRRLEGGLNDGVELLGLRGRIMRTFDALGIFVANFFSVLRMLWGDDNRFLFHFFLCGLEGDWVYKVGADWQVYGAICSHC